MEAYEKQKQKGHLESKETDIEPLEATAQPSAESSKRTLNSVTHPAYSYVNNETRM